MTGQQIRHSRGRPGSSLPRNSAKTSRSWSALAFLNPRFARFCAITRTSLSRRTLWAFQGGMNQFLHSRAHARAGGQKLYER